MSTDPQYVTLVFKTDGSWFGDMPFQKETPFGVLTAVSMGNVLTERDELEKALRELKREVGQ